MLRFWSDTYGFILRKSFALPNEGRTPPADALAGGAESKSLFVGRDDLAEGERDPVRGQLMLYALTPPGNRIM